MPYCQTRVVKMRATFASGLKNQGNATLAQTTSLDHPSYYEHCYLGLQKHQLSNSQTRVIRMGVKFTSGLSNQANATLAQMTNDKLRPSFLL